MTAQLRSAQQPIKFLPDRPASIHPRAWMESRLRDLCGVLLPDQVIAEVMREADGYAAAMIEHEWHKPYTGSRAAARLARPDGAS